MKHPQIKIVKNLEEATVIWMEGPFDETKWGEYKHKYYINQFPFEGCVVMKHNLAETIQTTLGNTPFLMRTYNL